LLCFEVQRHFTARPTYAIPTTQRQKVFREVIANPSGLMEYQWRCPDGIKECVNALEQRLVQSVFSVGSALLAIDIESGKEDGVLKAHLLGIDS
jgi:hypothetical protein